MIERPYEIIHLDRSNNTLYGTQETAAVGVSLSGGLGSAFAGELAIKRYGRENVFFWFADVQVEDPDLYRFVFDLMKRWGGRLYWFTEGRTPKQVWEKHGIIPNNRMCPCSFELKVKYFREFIKAMPTLPTVCIGYKYTETERHVRTCTSYQQAIPECIVEYPLTWEPVETRDLAEICQEVLGITPPRLYGEGFDYNNCGSDCCRSGIGGRVLEAIRHPDRFWESLEWEERMRAKGGALAGKAFCAIQVKGQKTPITLREIWEQYVPQVLAYLQANPNVPISEKTILRETRKWQRMQSKAHQMINRPPVPIDEDAL